MLCVPQAGARICKTLGSDFLPYLQLVMPPLLAAAKVGVRTLLPLLLRPPRSAPGAAGRGKEVAGRWLVADAAPPLCHAGQRVRAGLDRSSSRAPPSFLVCCPRDLYFLLSSMCTHSQMLLQHYLPLPPLMPLLSVAKAGPDGQGRPGRHHCGGF
jgi:hypothetical protein